MEDRTDGHRRPVVADEVPPRVLSIPGGLLRPGHPLLPTPPLHLLADRATTADHSEHPMRPTAAASIGLGRQRADASVRRRSADLAQRCAGGIPSLCECARVRAAGRHQ
jgi:hypothetical protein